MDKRTLKSTAALWKKAFEDELLDDLEADVAIGAHYAKLALDGTIKLTESGVEKVRAAREALAELVGEDYE